MITIDIGASLKGFIGDSAWSYAVGAVAPAVKRLMEETQTAMFGTLIREGMVLAIEPMLTLGTWQAKVDADGWTARTVDGSICVQYEHTVAVTTDGPALLTVL